MNMSGVRNKILTQLRKMSWLERAGAVIVAAALIFGFSQIAQGVYIKIKAEAAQVLLERAWDRAMAGERAPKPWPWADTWPVARIEALRLKKSAIVLMGASGEAMAFGPGHISYTPLPGRRGTAVIAAHRDTHFAFLKDIRAGDELRVTNADGSQYRFKVSRFEVVDAGASGIEPSGPGYNLALVTCWPFNSNTRGSLRYIVHATRI
jgi:sortase A